MIVQQHGKALGSDIVFTLKVKQAADGEAILKKLRAFLGEFESRFSRFQPDSELTFVNAHAGEPCSVSPAFAQLARMAAKMSRYSGGLYNPLLLPQLQRAGYVGSWPAPTELGRTPDYRGRSGSTEGQLSVHEKTVTLPSGTALDFGGIGKGYALDEIAERIESSGCVDYWVSLGGDIIGRGSDENGSPWRIRLGELHGTDTDVFETLSQKERTAIATSTRLKRQGAGWHHIIDPRTGKPADTPVESAVVVAKTGVLADVMAKCLLIAGAHAGEYWQKHTQQTAYIQYAKRWEKFD